MQTLDSKFRLFRTVFVLVVFGFTFQVHAGVYLEGDWLGSDDHF